MITHCPACSTHFRVHAGQLAARGGQVRCGKCNRVFNALEHLIEEGGGLSASQAKSGQEAQHVDGRTDAPASEPATVQTEPGLESPSPPALVLAAETEGISDAPQPSTEAPAIPEIEAPTAAFAELPRSEISAGPEAAEFGFGPNERSKPERSARRWPWVAGAIFLLVALLAQLAHQFRSAIIVLFPETKPYAVSLCETLGCDLPLPRRIDQLSIEASDLQADTTNPNVMVLSATLKNRALFSQQHPLLELTLTDSQDQPVVRRVLSPADYLGKSAGNQSGFAANSEIAAKVFIEGSQVKATGYRLYLFYP